MVSLFGTASSGIAGTAAYANDSITLPPPSRVVNSANNSYSFRITTSDNWRTPFPQGVLTSNSNARLRLTWSGKLPQYYGPRFALVTSTGDVILVDSWLNTKPIPAIAILNHGKRSWVSFGFDDVLRSLGVSAARVAEKARFGSWWISGKPYLDAAENRVLIPAGGQNLMVDLRRNTIVSQQ